MKKINSRCVVLLSGGQNSTTALFWAMKKFKNVMAVSFDYGQRHKIELKSAAKIAKLAGVKHTVIVVKEYEAIQNSALLDKTSSINKHDKINKKLPASFVPGRNILFLTAAAAYAYVNKAENIVIGVSQADYSGYPDCRGEFIRSMEKSLSLGMEYPVKIHTPLLNKNKMQTVLLAKELKVLDMMKYTHTCYEGNNKPCNKCPACRLRAKGFKEAGIADPLKHN